MALESAKSSDLWRYKAQKMPIYGVIKRKKMPIYGVGKCKKCRFMALELNYLLFLQYLKSNIYGR